MYHGSKIQRNSVIDSEDGTVMGHASKRSTNEMNANM